MSKTHWKKWTNPDYLGSYSFQPDEEKTLTIQKVVQEQVFNPSNNSKEDCTVCHFKEDEKPMILNATNCKMISKLYDSPYLEDWSGKQVTIHVANIRAFGETMEALRIKPTVSKAAKLKPELTPDHERWAGAKQALEENNITIQELEKHFTISQENIDKLCGYSK